MAQRRSRRSATSREGQPLSEYWRGKHQSWLSSGQTQAAYCEQHDLSLPSFRWWRWKLKKECGPVGPSAVPVKSTGQDMRLVPVRVVESQVAMSVPVEVSASGNPSLIFEIVLESGTCVRVPGDFDAEALGRLLRTLEVVSC